MSAKEAEKGALGTPVKSYFDDYSRLILEPLRDSGLELGKLFPDSILFGTILLYCLTQNLSFGVLAIFFLETSLIHQFVGFMYEKSVGPAQYKYTSKTTDAEILSCRSGFRTPRKEVERTFLQDTYPSVSVFFWGSFVAYMMSSNAAFASILSKMGTDWQPRIIFASITIGLASSVFLIARHTTGGGCDSTSELLLALLTGIVCGVILYFLNYQLFGLEGLNYNGLPILVDKIEQGSNIYVCAPSQ